MKKPFICINFPADNSGCSFYRMTAPKLSIQSTNTNINFNELRRFITDQKWFGDVNLVHLQRQVSTSQKEYFTKFLVPLSRQTGMWVIYNVDDAIHMDDIPKYNQAWKAYQKQELMNNVRDMIHVTDFLLVTTEYLKNYYVTKFGANEKTTLVIPNFLPKWWMGQYYDTQKISLNFEKYKKRPRIGIIASSTHFDINNNNNGIDDFTHIIDYIKKTKKKYEWVFVGTCPKQLEDGMRKGDYTFVRGTNIMNYPDVIGNLNCQAIVQPLINNEFNRCKSNIKYLEAAAIGTPLIAQNLDIYSKYTKLVFDDAKGLDRQLNTILSNKKKFMAEVKKQWNELNHGRCGKGWWLENNLDAWQQFYGLTKKCIDIDVPKCIEHQKQKESQKTSELEIIR